MKKKSNAGKLVNILIWITAVILAIVILAFVAMRFVIVPRVSEHLSQSGKEGLATIIDENNNLGAFAMLGIFLSDRGMIDFVTALDKKSATDVIEFLDTIDSEQQSEPSNPETPWQVTLPENAPKPVATPQPTPYIKDAETAYDRISKAASDKEMADGIAILSKLDMSYVASLVSGGLTVKEKAELKKYVYSRLSKAEISRALALYNKYKNLL